MFESILTATSTCVNLYYGYDLPDFSAFLSPTFSLLGNSLGGHIALILAIKYPKKVNKLILSGSSGLYENTLGGKFPKRGDYNYIKNKIEEVFFDHKKATKKFRESFGEHPFN